MKELRKQILWVDDEIELLKPHILYLGERGYEITEVTNGPDAIELVKEKQFDLALIDEMMPVMNGLELLRRLKEIRSELPAVMVTKSEAEELMEQAIGEHIDGFLTKPVNPSQILSVVKSIVDKRQISETQLSRRWAEGFAELSQLIDEDLDTNGWIDLHTRISTWDLELDRWGDESLKEMLSDIRQEAEARFSRWIEFSYEGWIAASPDERPPLSMDVVNKWLLPLLDDDGPVLFLVVDCLRFDQWMVLEPLLTEQFEIKSEGYLSILPSATPYSRNAIFSGLLPYDLEMVHPEIWAVGDEDEGSSNRYEHQFLDELLKRRGITLQPELRYVKVLEQDEASEFERRVKDYLHTPLTAMVYNFVDILLHTRQSVEVLKEMLPDESAFRSVTEAWFKHSSLYRIIQAFGEAGGKILLTSDHGSIRGRKGSRVIGDRKTSTNLRYKHGRNLQFDDRHGIKIREPIKWGLPLRGINTDYIIAKEDYFFLYPNNYHKYLELYKDSFQHGGISMNEMVLPVVTMTAKG
ncbi:MAG: response regulator [Calditrichaeota bacterium]|nr:response regulator [Calditrichota bacterium]